MTRLRLTLQDAAKTVDDETIKHISGVIGLVKHDASYQIIIGPGVDAVYLELIKQGDIMKRQMREAK